MRRSGVSRKRFGVGRIYLAILTPKSTVKRMRKGHPANSVRLCGIGGKGEALFTAWERALIELRVRGAEDLHPDQLTPLIQNETQIHPLFAGHSVWIRPYRLDPFLDHLKIGGEIGTAQG